MTDDACDDICMLNSNTKVFLQKRKHISRFRHTVVNNMEMYKRLFCFIELCFIVLHACNDKYSHKDTIPMGKDTLLKR